MGTVIWHKMDRPQNEPPKNSWADSGSDPVEELSNAYVAMVSDALDLLGHRDQVLAPGLLPLAEGSRVMGRAFPIEIAAVDRLPSLPYAGEMSAIETIARGGYRMADPAAP